MIELEPKDRMPDARWFRWALVLTLPLNVAWPCATWLLSELDWWFLAYAMFVAFPLGTVSGFVTRAAIRNLPDPVPPTVGAYLGFSALNFAVWGGYTLFKAVTLQWGGH